MARWYDDSDAAVLKVRGDAQRHVWIVDSFSGLPTPDNSVDSFWRKVGDMAVSLDEVRENFARYGLFYDGVTFLKGYFEDTLQDAPITELSVLRVDADLYQSTLDVLNNFYAKLFGGGCAIFDDYQNLPECRRAIDEYRDGHGITKPIVAIDTWSIYWIKAAI